jgi:hypothetical protein
LDKKYFAQLIALWRPISDNDKIKSLFDNLTTEKTVVFTEYKSTLDILVKEAIQRGLRVIGHSGESNEAQLVLVQKEFDANLPLGEQENNYDLLITTDVLSEGVNLHRANHLYHFDTKWNPSRTTQREGRVNRILSNGISRTIQTHEYDFVEIIETILDLEGKIGKKLDLANKLLNINHDPYLNNGTRYEFQNNTFYTKGQGEYYGKRIFIFRNPIEDIALVEPTFLDKNIELTTVDLNGVVIDEKKQFYHNLRCYRRESPGRTDGGQLRAITNLIDDKKVIRLFSHNQLYSPILGNLIKEKIKSEKMKATIEFTNLIMGKLDFEMEYCIVDEKHSV